MNIFAKYKLDKNQHCIINELPKVMNKYIYIVEEKNNYDKLYINENGIANLISSVKSRGSILQLFLKKYRKNPELLPRNLKHEIKDYLSSDIIYKIMKIMLTPVNNYEEFKTIVTKTTKEIKPLILTDLWGYGSQEYYTRLSKSKYGSEFIFLNSKDEMGIKQTNMNGDVLEEVPDYRHLCIYHNKEDKQYEIWQYLSDTDSRGHAHYYIDAIFYEEKYLYEYLLNYTLEAVVP